MPRGEFSPCSLFDRYVAFLRHGEEPVYTVELFDLESHEITTTKSSLTGMGMLGRVTLSRDGRWLLYTRADTSGADLMLVENVP